MSDEAFSNLKRAFAESFTSRREQVAAIMQCLPEMKEEAAGLFLDSLFGLSNLRVSDGLAAKDVAAEVSALPELELPAKSRGPLAERLAYLLASRPISLLAKSADVQTENQRSFQSARTLTDIRPVFEQEQERDQEQVPLEWPVGVVLVHNLKIDFLNSEDHPESIYLALDDNDLAKFHRVLSRALQKSVIVRELLQKAGWTHYEPLED